MSDLSFASDFPQPTRDQWLKLVEGVLKGVPFDKKLVATTADGLRIEPLYPKAEGSAPIAGRAPGAPWQVLARIDHPDGKAANAQALHDLENGATGLHVVFAGSIGANGFGLADGGTEAIAALFEGVVLDAGIRVELDLSLECKDAAEALIAFVAARGIDPAACDIAFGYDPMGQMALRGGAPIDWGTLRPMFGGLAKTILERGFGGSVCSADGRIVHAAGGSEAQELAFVVASALAYWRALEAAGIDLDKARRAIGFRLAADADQFMTIAKARALRRLWAHVEASAGLAPSPIRLHAETAWRMTTRRDPWVNLLRATVAVFAAGVGGADAISVTPFTQALGLPDAFARRLARNTQLVLLEESNLARVADPAAGSGGMEALTDELAGAAWVLVQETEAKGGLDRVLADGSFQAKVTAAREARAKALARRKEALTGTSEFPHIAEPRSPWPRHTPPRPPPVSGSSRRWSRPGSPNPTRRCATAPTPRRRAPRSSSRPSALSPTSQPARPSPRTCSRPEASPRRCRTASRRARPRTWRRWSPPSRASGARIACLCSTDARYAAEGAAAAQALKAAGCAKLWLAGRPAEIEAALREAGVDGFVFVGCDVLATLEDAHATLGLE